MKISDKMRSSIQGYLTLILVIMVIVLFFLCANILLMTMGDEFQNINYAVGLENNINDKNLTIPYPSFNVELIGYKSVTDEVAELFGKPIEEYMEFIQEVYYYNESYDCKYWAYIHSLYFVVVKDTYDYKLKYIATPNHIFVMLYNESGYCILDGDEYVCLMQEI